MISVFIGAILTLFTTSGYDLIKENREREKLANILYIEVQNNLLNVYVMLNQIGTREEFIKWEGYVANNFDFRILNASIKDVQLLSTIENRNIFDFYEDLSKADEAKNMLAVTPRANKEFWLGRIYDNYLHSIKYGKFIMSDFEKTYNIHPSEEIKEDINKLEKKILKSNPDLNSKIIEGPVL